MNENKEEQEIDFGKEYEGMNNMERIEKLLAEMANRIHPDMAKMATLTSALKAIQDVNEAIELSDVLSAKLCNVQIDLYTLIKDIAKEKGIPEGVIVALDQSLKTPAREF